MNEKRFSIGVDNAGDRSDAYKHPLWIESLKRLGVEFVIYHYVPQGGLTEQVAFIRGLSALCEDNGLQYVINTEHANWVESLVDEDGWDWCSGLDGLHYFHFKPEVLKAACESPAFAGIMFDEAEHMQIHRSWVWTGDVDAKENIQHQKTKTDFVFLGDTTGMSFTEAEQLVLDNGKRLTANLKGMGVPRVVTEHVFPVLFHNFAEAGMIPSCKQMKESWTPVWMACAMGAALQYGRDLWTCLDLWFSDRYPGHTPEELRSNLLFGYWMGTDRMYVENLNYEGSLVEYIEENGSISPRLTPWGEQLQWFAQQYLPSHHRAYSFRDVKPEIAIIRFDDTDFGQAGEPFWPEWLYGSKTLKTTEATSHWLRIWHVLSHGVIPANSLSWNTAKYERIPHRSFAPLNGVVVYDHKVRRKLLTSLKLAFLSGIAVSRETLRDVADSVEQNGLVVVTPPELAPNFLNRVYTGGTEVMASGKGKWIITDNVQSDQVYEQIRHYLGKEDEIRYVFGEREIVFQIRNGDEVEVVIDQTHRQRESGS